MVFILIFAGLGLSSTSYGAEKNVSTNETTITYDEYSSIQIGMTKNDVESLVGGAGKSISSGISYMGDKDDPHMITSVEVKFVNDVVSQKDIWYALTFNKKNERYYYEANSKVNRDRTTKFIAPAYSHESSSGNSKSDLVTKLSVLNVEELDASKCEGLKELYCNDGITKLNVSNNKGLIKLDCSVNYLSYLDISNNTELVELICYGNLLKSLDVSKNTKLKKLNCFQNELKKLNLNGNPELIELYCEQNDIVTLNVEKCVKLRTIYCASNELRELKLTKNKDLRLLACKRNQIKRLNLSNCKKLKYLNCINNNMTSLNIKSCSSLEELVCTNNKIGKLDVLKLKKLKSVHCQNNKIKRHYFAKNSKLIDLVVDRKLPKEKLSKKLKKTKAKHYPGGWQYKI